MHTHHRIAALARLLAAALCAAGLRTTPLRAQSIRGAVLAKREPHHHLAFEDSTLRVLRVHVAPHDTTLLHEHDPDYFWIALGSSNVVNARPGMPDATIKSADLSVHYTPGHFAHVARNPGDAAFDNITIELLRPQSHVRNLCEAAMAGQPLDCSASSVDFGGIEAHPAFRTDKLRVATAELPTGATLHAPTNAPSRGVWLITLDQADAAHLRVDDAGRWVGGVLHAGATRWTVTNQSGRPVRLLVVSE